MARSSNEKRDVTGALLTHGRRHDNVTVIFAEPVPDRVFSRWATAKVSDDGETDIPPLMNVTKGGISGPRRTRRHRNRTGSRTSMRDAVRETGEA